MRATVRLRHLLLLSVLLRVKDVAGQSVQRSVAATSSSVIDRISSLLFRPKPWAAPEPDQERIPKILHHIFLSGTKELRKAAAGPDPPMRIEWSENCVQQHDGWQVMFWDMAAALQLLRQDYPWFLETFQSYKRRVQQGDALRYFILHKHGGVYMDMDVECFRPTDSFLRGYDLVLNVELGEGLTVTNAVMASAPNNTFWPRVFTKMQERAAYRDEFLEYEVVASTGPWMLTDSLKEHLHIRTRSAGEYIRATGETIQFDAAIRPHALTEVVKVYEVGAWFTPCIFDDEQCHLSLVQAKQNGTIDLSRLAGYHRYQGTWKPCMGECFKDKDHRTKGDQDPLQGNVSESLFTPPSADGQQTGAQRSEPAQAPDSPVLADDTQTSESDSSSSHQSDQAIAGSSHGSSNGMSSEDSDIRASSTMQPQQARRLGMKLPSDAGPAETPSFLRHITNFRPHKRKAGS